MDVPQKVPRLCPSRIVDDAQFQGANDTQLSRAVSSYALRCCGSVAHYHFPSIGSAPKATITASNAWTSFDHVGRDTCTFDVPWLHQSQFYGIRASIRVATKTWGVFLLRIQSDDLVDAVASTENGRAKGIPYQRSSFLHWRTTNYIDGLQYSSRLWRIISVEVTLASPTLPANRRVSVKPQIYLKGIGDLMLGVAGNPVVRLESMILRDITDRDEHA